MNLLTLPGTAASTCDDWTSSAAGSDRGAMGSAGDSQLLEQFGALPWGCNYGGSAKLACLEL